MPRKITPEIQRCIDLCLKCYMTCAQTATYCLEMGGEHSKAPHIRLLQDCTLICMTSANFISGSSPYQSQACQLCADICTNCAENCERLGGDDVQMQECAETCRKCADACQQMSQSLATAR